MEIGELFTDSIDYTKEAFVGKWIRWVIFVICALPFALIQYVFDPKKFMSGTDINWGAIPWGQIAVLAGIGFILSFFLSGYIVRIYRGEKPAPDFTGWTRLFVDGVKLEIVWVLWFLPLVIVLVAGIGIAFASYVSVRSSETTLMLFGSVLALLLVELVLFVIVMILGIIGVVRFARTGSIREGIRVSAILATIRSMGWPAYLVAFIGFVVAAAIYAVITSALNFIPVIGWALVLFITPFFTVFAARYFTLLYEQAASQPVVQAPVR
jgi:hypothetical protein